MQKCDPTGPYCNRSNAMSMRQIWHDCCRTKADKKANWNCKPFSTWGPHDVFYSIADSHPSALHALANPYRICNTVVIRKHQMLIGGIRVMFGHHRWTGGDATLHPLVRRRGEASVLWLRSHRRRGRFRRWWWHRCRKDPKRQWHGMWRRMMSFTAKRWEDDCIISCSWNVCCTVGLWAPTAEAPPPATSTPAAGKGINGE